MYTEVYIQLCRMLDHIPVTVWLANATVWIKPILYIDTSDILERLMATEFQTESNDDENHTYMTNDRKIHSSDVILALTGFWIGGVFVSS